MKRLRKEEGTTQNLWQLWTLNLLSLSSSVEQEFMYPSSQDDVNQLAESCLSTADLSAFCSCKASEIDTLQFIAHLQFSISHVAPVLGRQVLCGESVC